MTRVLALDVGKKRIGVALSDALRMIAQPYGYVENQTEEQVLDELKQIIEKEQVNQVVVGMPKRLDGSKGELAQLSKELGNQIRNQLDMPVKFWDERYSTHAAERMLLEADVRRNKRKQVIDQTTAAWILQGYLDAQPNP